MHEIWHRLTYGITASVWTLQDPRCHGCGCWMPTDRALTRTYWCTECQIKFGVHGVQPYSGLISAACTLTPRLKHLMYRWKFHPRHPGALVLASLLCSGLTALTAMPADLRRNIMLMPIPPRKKPGISQSIFNDRLVRLSGLTAALLGVRWLPDGLQYQRATDTQHFLASRAARFDNMRHAFSLSPKLEAIVTVHTQTPDAPPLTLIVLDDLTTSGATLLAARTALLDRTSCDMIPLAVAQVPLKSEISPSETFQPA